MKKIQEFLCIFLCVWAFQLFGIEFSNGPKVVFVHIGNSLPSYLKIAIRQVRLFNDCEIILVANKEALDSSQVDFSEENVACIACEEILKTDQHINFFRNNRLDQITRGGFWSHAKERFFYLHDLILQYNLEHVVHLENDNMLYVDINEILPILKCEYPTLASTFDNEDRCIPGFFYVSNANSMEPFVEFLSSPESGGDWDMESIANYRKTHGNSAIKALPIIHDTYADVHPLQSRTGKTVQDKNSVSSHIDKFNSIFDAAALGQYLGGLDPYHNLGLHIGFINEACVFNPSHLQYEWEIDSQGRKVPFATFSGKKVRINNLHIFSKMLENFAS